MVGANLLGLDTGSTKVSYLKPRKPYLQRRF